MATLFLLLIYAAFISLGLPDSLLGVAWPAMQFDIGVPFSYAGFISMTVSGGTIVSSLLSGRVLERFGTGLVTFVSVLMTATALLGFALAPSFFWYLLLAIPLGLGGGSVDAGLNDYVSKHFQARHMNWLHCFWGVGAMISPIIMSQNIGDGNSWRNGYLTVAAIQFTLVAILFFAIPMWNRVAAANGTHGGESPADAEPAHNGRKGIFYPLRVPGVSYAALVFLFYCGVEATVGLWGSSYLVGGRGLEPATAALWVSLYYGSITLGRFLSGFVSMRLSSKALIRGGVVSILLGALVLLLPLPAEAALVAFILIGLGCAPIFPAMIHETPARFGVVDSQRIMGFQMAVAYTGTTLLPPLFGFVASVTTTALLPVFVLLYAALMMFNSERVNAFVRQKFAGVAPVRR
jgi:fucose permease